MSDEDVPEIPPAPTSDLASARTALAALLNEIPNVRAVTVVPKTFTPPLVWVKAREPYRQRAQAVGRKKVNLTVICVGGMSTNDAALEEAERIAELVADKIDSQTTFRLDPSAEMDEPGYYKTAQGQDMLGIGVNCFCETTRG